MRVLFSRSCGDPQISSSWCQPSRRLPWQRAGVVAYGRRPKNPDLQLQEPGSSSSPAGLTGSGSTAGGETLRLEGLSAAQSNRSEFPSPSTAPVSALEQDPFKQQRSAAAAAAQPGTAAPRRRRGRPRRQDNAAVTGQGSLPSSNRGVSVIESMDQATLSDILSDAEEDEQYEAAGEEEDTDGGSDAELERLPAGAAALGSSDEEGGTGTADSEEPPGPTEIVFKLERRGDGWGEEIFPHITMEKRPLIKSKHKCQHPDPWEDGSLEYYLIEVGVPPEDVDRVVEQAVAWRFTPGGRALIDRRRRSRVERNVRLVVQHLEMEGGIPFGPKGMGAILARVPEIMLCKPTTNDRWDRRAVELVAFQHTHGHCNVPEEWAQNPELGAWVKRQRLARAAGQLSDDRLAILQGLGFEFGEVAQLTDEWEHRFDQLIDWMLWHKENQQRFSWLGVDWGQRGGITARELALWVSLQGEFRRRNLLPAEAIKRFEAIGVDWEAQDGTPAEREWMAQFSRLLYVIERHNTVTRPYLLQTARLGRPKAGSASVQGMPGSHAGAAGVGLEEEEEDAGDEETYRKSTSAILRGRAKLQQELAARRRALAVADLRCEPGLRFWLERQRWLWRQGRLPSEQVLMLQLAGVDMERYTSAQWQEEAHLAAALLQRSEITLSPPPHTPAAAAAEGPRAAAGGMGSAAVQQQARQQQQQVPGPGQRWGGSSVAQQGHQHSAAQPAASGWSRGQQVPHQQQWRSGQQAAQVSGPLAAATYGGRPGSSLDSIAERNGNSSGSSSSQQALSADFGQAVAFASSNSSSGCGSALAAAAGASGSVGGGGILRLRVRRWVQTQAALFHEGHLSPAQLRYLAFLGITWVVSDEVMHMGDASWRARFEQLLALCKQAAADGIPPAAAAAIVADRDLREWLRHQRGLHALGMLREDRRRLLGALGVGWGHPRGEAERAWDARLSELLAFKAEHGHLQVPLKYGPYPPLGPWVEAQRRLLGLEGALDPGCAAQLAAIGLQPSPSTAP